MRALVLPFVVACGGSSVPADAPSREPEPVVEAAAPRRAVSHAGGPSCEEAMAEHAGEQPPTPPSDEAVAGVKDALNRGTYLNQCQIAASSAVEVCAAIMKGEVLGVTVTIDPGTAGEADCVAGEVKRLEYPASDSLIRASTTFDPSLGP